MIKFTYFNGKASLNQCESFQNWYCCQKC